jgi:hypothetical protein
MEKIGGAVRDTAVLLHWVPVDFVATSIVSLTKKYAMRNRRGREEIEAERGRS